MTLGQITAADIAGWDSLQDIAESFEKRGLKPRPSLGADNELVLQLADDEFMVLVEAGPGESATEFKPRDVDRRHTNLVATNDFEEFTFLTRVRTFGQQHGQIKHQKLSFTKSQFTRESGEKNTVLSKLNEFEYGSSAAIYGDLYDTRRIVSEFYEEFEELRTDLVQEVSGIPDDRGDAKQRYVQVTLDRMIFLYFIQEKRLLDRDPEYLHTHHEDVVAEGDDADVYEKFYQPLFFEYLAEGKKDPDFKNLPYLNGGLFTKNPVEEAFPEARLGATAEETNALFGRILDFLSGWNWNVDERLDIVDPKNLSPAVLGHIFEQTVNQKEKGAYYTPEEITGFMTRRSIQPYLLDQLNEAVGADYEEIDEVFALDEPDAAGEEAVAADGGTMTQQGPTGAVTTEHVERLYFDILQEVRVLDPAVGSGAFLLAAQDVLLDVYLQCLEFFEEMERESMGWKLAGRTREELEQIQERKGSKRLYAKREIILHNLYGVDIDDGAVEICKLRLWLSMVADIEDEPREVEPLPNIDFNIRQGNSLIGFTEVQEVATDDGDASLNNFGAGAGTGVKELYDDVIEAIERHQNATSAKEAANARKLAESRIAEHSKKLDEKVLEQFQSAGLDEMDVNSIRDFHPFHWVLEFAPVYRDGGFDVVIGNPPWERLKPSRDEYFSQYDEIFRTRPKSEKDEIQEDLLTDPEIEQGWQEHQEKMQYRTSYFDGSDSYNLQNPKINGRGISTQKDLSALFLERVFGLTDGYGYVAQILPNTIFNGSLGKDLRGHMLDNTDIQSVVRFENNGIFDGLHNQYKFGVVVFKNSGKTEGVEGIFNQKSTSSLKSFDSNTLYIPRRVLEEYSPEVRIFPSVESQQKVNLLNNLFRHPSVGEKVSDAWWIEPYRSLHGTDDADRLFEESERGDYPVYQGKNIYQYSFDDRFIDVEQISLWSVDGSTNPDRSGKKRFREKAVRNLKSAIYEQMDGGDTSKSQKGFVNDLLDKHRGTPLAETDVKLDSDEYRIGFRQVTNATNERTLVAAIIPRNVMCLNTLTTVRPYEIEVSESDLSNNLLYSVYKRIFSDKELCVALGLLNSIPFDYLMRTKVDSHIVMYKLRETQMPRLTDGDDWFHYIADRAARLNCYGEAFAEMRERLGGIEPATEERERRRLQAEIDAAAFHAYGLDREDTAFVLDDFHRVENPRLMDEAYFEMVLEKYDELAEVGPKT